MSFESAKGAKCSTMITEDEEVEYMRIGMATCGYNIPKKDIHLFITIYKKMIEKDGDLGLKEVVKLQVENDQRYNPVPEEDD